MSSSSQDNSAFIVCHESSPDIDQHIQQQQELIKTMEERNTMQATRPKPRPRNYNREVQFSESSMLFLYHEDPSCVKKDMFYTTEDRKIASQRTLRAAIQLKRMLLVARQQQQNDAKSSSKDANTSPSSSTSTLSLEDHFKACGIPKEEIVGIEHLVLEDPVRTIERRNNHIQMVLMEQENQRSMGTNDCGRLAQISGLLAKRTTTQARNRAAMAA